jgi:hypothetical protein
MAGGPYARWDETMAKRNVDSVSTVSVKMPSGILAGLDRVAALTGRSRRSSRLNFRGLEIRRVAAIDEDQYERVTANARAAMSAGSPETP